MSNTGVTPIFEDYTDPNTAVLPASPANPAVPPPPSTSGLGALARIPPSVMATPKKQSPFALTKTETAPATPGINPLPFTPNYFRQAAGVQAGVPGSAAPMTKLGKLLYILKGVGTGAAVGSGQSTFAGGFQAAQQNDQQQRQFEASQEQARLGMEQARANLAMMPLYKAAQIEQMRQNAATKESQEELNRSKAQRWGKPYQVGTRMMATNPDTGQLEDVGPAKAGKPTVREMGDRTYQYDESANTWKDVGPAKAGSQTPYGKLPQEIFAMVGAMPTTSTWEGKDYGSVQGAMNAWGREAMALKDSEAKSRAAGYADTRGQVVTDTETGITAPVVWSKLNAAPPGKYVSPQYDPNTRLAVKAWQDLAPSGKLGTQVTSYNTFLRHAGSLYDAVEGLRNSGFPDWNKPMNWLRTHSGDPRVKEFLAKLDPVQKEFQSFLLNNRALYSEDRETAQNMLNANDSPQTMYTVLRSLIHTGNARLAESNDTFNRATGTDIPQLLSPQAQAALEKVGGPEAAAEMPPIVPRGARVGGPRKPSAAGIKVADPRGVIHTFPDQASADNFKRLAGIK